MDFESRLLNVKKTEVSKELRSDFFSWFSVIFPMLCMRHSTIIAVWQRCFVTWQWHTHKTFSTDVNRIKRMICLLCYESNKDSIRLVSQEGKQHRVSSLLFKYFRFCFEVCETERQGWRYKMVFNSINLHLQTEPTNGNLCKVCWQKVVVFHEFYMQIESIFEQTNKNRIVSSILNVKEETIEEVVCEQLDECIDSESSLKCEPVFSDDSTDGSKAVTVSIHYS